MSEMEIFVMNEKGAGWTPLSQLAFADRVELDLAVRSTTSVQLLCVVCGVNVPSGMGHSYCVRHKPVAKYCDTCDCEMMVDALYCSHCFTGRIGTTPTGERYHIPNDTPRCR